MFLQRKFGQLCICAIQVSVTLFLIMWADISYFSWLFTLFLSPFFVYMLLLNFFFFFLHPIIYSLIFFFPFFLIFWYLLFLPLFTFSLCFFIFPTQIIRFWNAAFWVLSSTHFVPYILSWLNLIYLDFGRSYQTRLVFPGADIDCLAGRFYWTDVRSSTIRSSKYDGTERRPTTTQGMCTLETIIIIHFVSAFNICCEVRNLMIDFMCWPYINTQSR